MIRLIAIVLILVCSGCSSLELDPPEQSHHSKEITERLGPALKKRMKSLGLRAGSPIYLRVFKEERDLEVWMRGPKGKYWLFGVYPIKAVSGGLGPKVSPEDLQAPEGFYGVTRGRLNPYSYYHLGLNLGFPNPYDRAQGWDGERMMIHGDVDSKGCYAMGDIYIETIYTLCHTSFLGGNREVPIHCFPFRMNGLNMFDYQEDPHYEFWKKLEPAYRLFEKHGRVPAVAVENGEYQITMPPLEVKPPKQLPNF